MHVGNKKVTGVTDFDNLTKQFFAEYPKVEFKKKSLVCGGKRNCNDIFYLVKGFVQMYTYDDENRKVLIHIFRPGAFFPLIPQLTSWPNHREYEFQATTPVTVYKASAEATLNFLRTNPDVLFSTFTRLIDALVGSVERFKQMNKDTNSRIVSLLLYLVRSFGKTTDNKAVIKINLTHQDVASWIGVSRESVSRFLSELKRKKIIKSTHGSLLINDLHKLADLV